MHMSEINITLLVLVVSSIDQEKNEQGTGLYQDKWDERGLGHKLS